jgi:hypothetical protein
MNKYNDSRHELQYKQDVIDIYHRNLFFKKLLDASTRRCKMIQNKQDKNPLKYRCVCKELSDAFNIRCTCKMQGDLCEHCEAIYYYPDDNTCNECLKFYRLDF